VDDSGVDGLVRGEVELLDPLRSREAGVVDAASGAALVPVFALGHHQFGEEAEVGQLFALQRNADLAGRLGSALLPRIDRGTIVRERRRGTRLRSRLRAPD
jgi:hypothetical protein